MRHSGLLLWVVGAVLAGSPALAADRLTDRDLKALVSKVEQERDRFEDALDSQLKRSVLRSPSGEVDVEHFLDDFQANVERLRERLAPDYAASTEVTAVLRQGSAIAAFFADRPAGSKGSSEWTRLSGDLSTLAAAYGTTFPYDNASPVRRVGDRELAAALDGVKRGASGLRRSLDKELKAAKVDKAARQGPVREVEQLEKDAGTLASRVRGSDPSSSEAERLLERAAKVGETLRGLAAPASSSAWGTLQPTLSSLAGAYGRTWTAQP
jgi:hypothetical protein